MLLQVLPEQQHPTHLTCAAMIWGLGRVAGLASAPPHLIYPVQLFCTRNNFEKVFCWDRGFLAPEEVAIPHPPTTEQEAQSAAQATEPTPNTAVFLCLKGHMSSFTHLALQVPPALPVPGSGHRSFLLQELGAGNSKRDSSLGTGLAFSTLWKGPLKCTGILHSASPPF